MAVGLNSEVSAHSGMLTEDSKRLECGCRVIYAGGPSFFCFGIGVRSHSNFWASTVRVDGGLKADDDGCVGFLRGLIQRVQVPMIWDLEYLRIWVLGPSG